MAENKAIAGGSMFIPNVLGYKNKTLQGEESGFRITLDVKNGFCCWSGGGPGTLPEQVCL